MKKINFLHLSILSILLSIFGSSAFAEPINQSISCEVDEDCTNTEICSLVTKHCIKFTGCKQDADCSSDQICDQSKHRCELKVYFCDNGKSCPDGQSCNSETFVCEWFGAHGYEFQGGLGCSLTKQTKPAQAVYLGMITLLSAAGIFVINYLVRKRRLNRTTKV